MAIGYSAQRGNHNYYRLVNSLYYFFQIKDALWRTYGCSSEFKYSHFLLYVILAAVRLTFGAKLLIPHKLMAVNFTFLSIFSLNICRLTRLTDKRNVSGFAECPTFGEGTGIRSLWESLCRECLFIPVIVSRDRHTALRGWSKRARKRLFGEVLQVAVNPFIIFAKNIRHIF